ncbi:MAG: carbonic anhydrase, partial [Maribacter sp.]|nr:carbonic anhydrase [Maribacter sp.]
MITKTIDKAAQSALTPNTVLDDLMNGNQRYIQSTMETRSYESQRNTTVSGQFPKAVILSCIDSRVPVETIFDQGIGDVFVARIAGNFENTDILGSLEYSCKAAGSK